MMDQSGQAPGRGAAVVVGWPPFSDHSISGGNVKRPRSSGSERSPRCGGRASRRRLRRRQLGVLDTRSRVRRQRRQGVQDRARHRHRRARRQELQPPCLRRDPAREVAARHRLQGARVAPGVRVRPQPPDAGRGPLRPRDRGRVPHGRRRSSRSRRRSRPPTSRSSTTRPTNRRWRTSRACCSRSRSRATWPATWRRSMSKTAPSRPSAARRSRRSTTTSRATSPAPRPPTRGEGAERLLETLHRHRRSASSSR